MAAIRAVLDAGDSPFAASHALYQGLFLGEVYLAPLLGGAAAVIALAAVAVATYWIPARAHTTSAAG